MNYDDSIKDRIVSASDIVDIINQYVPLKRAGRTFKANCPFHQEKTPSFVVNPEKQIFRCFGCGAGGDVFSFLMKYENLSFPEAMRYLAERAHIELPKQMSRDDGKKTEREQLFEMYRIAAEAYHQEFLHPVRGKIAQNYFYSRGYSPEIAKEFLIGWAPEGWKFLLEILVKKGFPESLLMKSGLIHRSDKGNLYDVFRARLLFPISNLQGKVVAFGGRIMEKKDDGPKYLNSPESLIFHKRRELFGLNLAKRFISTEKPQVLITEGYFDFLRLYTGGFKNVVATLGTSLTDDHVQLLHRFADEAIVIYDGDAAGQAASLRGVEVFLEGGMNVKLIRMPQGYDPDDFLAKQGSTEFQKLIDSAKDFFDYKLEVLSEKHNRWESLGLMRITQDFLETLIKVQNLLLLDRYLRRLSAALGVETETLKREFQKLQAKRQVPQFATANRPAQSINKSNEVSLSVDDSEIMFLILLMEDPRYREEAFQSFDTAWLLGQQTRSFFENIREGNQESRQWNWNQMLAKVTDEKLREKILENSMVEWNSPQDRDKAFRDCWHSLRRKGLQAKLQELQRQIRMLERVGDPEKLNDLLRQYQSCLIESKKDY